MSRHAARHLCCLALIGVLCVALGGASARAYPQAPADTASLDDILKEIATYDGGIDSAAFWKLRNYVLARKDDPRARGECEPKLVAFLASPATPVARMAASRALRVIASEQSVPALQALLADDRTSDTAVYVLQQIPGAATDKALVQALSKPAVSETTRIAVIAALGERRSTDAVAALVPLLERPTLAKAAATALGTIGNQPASQALVRAYPAALGDLKPTLAASLLECAEKSLKANDSGAALRLYTTLLADASLAIPFRRAAAMGRIDAAGSDAAKIVSDDLASPDELLQEAAIVRLRDVEPPVAIASVCARLPQLPDGSQVKLLAVLGSYPKDSVLPTILDRARSTSVPVRIAAMKALGPTGGAAEVPWLVQAAASARGPEQAAARGALGALKGREVDAAVLALLAQKPSEEMQTELLAAIGDRRIYPAKQVVASALSSPSSRVRLAALRTFRVVGTPSDISAVLDVYAATPDEVERTEAGRTTAALAQKMASPDNRSAAVKARVTGEKDAQLRARYISLLPVIGDNSALPLLRRALEATETAVVDAAVRALTAWPTSAALDDAMQIAKESRNETHRLLAITGLVRIIRLDRYRDPEAAVADLRQASDAAWRPEEQKLVLGALVQFPCRDALDLATRLQREPTVAAEAEAAVKKIEEALKVRTRHP